MYSATYIVWTYIGMISVIVSFYSFTLCIFHDAYSFFPKTPIGGYRQIDIESWYFNEQGSDPVYIGAPYKEWTSIITCHLHYAISTYSHALVKKTKGVVCYIHHVTKEPLCLLSDMLLRVSYNLLILTWFSDPIIDLNIGN